MAIVTFVGAGSTVFTRNLIGDLVSYTDLSDDLTFRLFDIDAERLATSAIVAKRIVSTVGCGATVESFTDRTAALDGADYVVTMFQIGGFDPSTLIDFDIPERYGLEQTIADTLGIGGVMRGLRTAPVLVDVAHDMERLCPEALLLNYANPMAINTWAVDAMADVSAVGLCHSVPLTAADLALDLGLDVDELDYQVGGINHMAFFLRLEHEGRDLYPRLKELFVDPADAPRRGRREMADAVRYEMMRRLGYFVTESSEHFAEYTPYFIKRDRPDLVDRFQVPLREYVTRCELQIADWDAQRERLEDPSTELRVRQSGEFAPQIIHSIECDVDRTVYVNVPNRGLIGNLPDACCVEVPATVSAAGIVPRAVGDLPPQLVGLIRTNVSVQELVIEALVTGNREHVHHAAMLDPHTAAELDLDQIWSLVDELLAAHGDMIPEPLRS